METYSGAFLLLAFMLLGLVTGGGVVNAVETYSLAASPDRVQEGSSPGVALSLTVSGGGPGPYQFVWVVADPAGNTYTAVKSTLTPQPNFVLTATFPIDFTNASIGFVGTYQATVNQAQPIPRLNVASAQFRAGITDSDSYQRTFPVFMRAVGYKADDTVTVDVTYNSLPVLGFPSANKTDPNGFFFYLWKTPPNLTIGSYTVTLQGAASPGKSPPDTQTFTVSTTSIEVSVFSMPNTNLLRTQSAEFFFLATYLSGNPVQGGWGTVIVAEPDDSTFHSIVANYDPLGGGFTATYQTPLYGPLGVWAAKVAPGSINDGYGNMGPSASSSSPFETFNLQPATLTVSSYVPNATYGSGDVVRVYATVATPRGTSFTEGIVTASFSISGQAVANPVSLSYDQSGGKWVGGYMVQARDPSGVWFVQLTASDSYGNRGTGSASLVVQVQIAQSPLLSLWWIFVTLAVAGGFTVAIMMMRRKVSMKELKVDLRLIEMEADRLKNQEFFKSIEEQLKKQEEAAGPDPGEGRTT